MENEIQLRFLSKRINIAIIRNMIGVVLVENNPTIAFINELKTVVSEAVTNAIVHGYCNQEDKYVDMKIMIKPECVAIEIIDNGVGIEDVEKAKEALFSTKADEERSGLGFTIMEMFCDKLIVSSKLNEGTKLYIEKKW